MGLIVFVPTVNGTTGYRRTSITPRDCIVELTSYLHNELFNIFSHGFALVICIFMLGRRLLEGDMAETKEAVEYGWLERYFWVCGCLVFAGSVAYHTFLSACETDKGYKRLLMLDVLGVWLICTVVTWKCLWLTLLCWHPLLKLSIVLFPSAFACFMLFKATNPAGRGTGLALMAIFRILVLVLRTLRMGVALDTRGGFYFWVFSELLAFGGGVINVMKIPEKLSNRPPWIELIGNSHNIMHVCTVFSFFFVWLAFWEDAQSAVDIHTSLDCGTTL